MPHYTDYDGPFLPSGKVKLAGMRNLLARKGMKGYMDSFTPSYFDHYFRMMYRILTFVDKTELIGDKDRYDYACILRALLSRYELGLVILQWSLGLWLREIQTINREILYASEPARRTSGR